MVPNNILSFDATNISFFIIKNKYIDINAILACGYIGKD